MEHEQEWLVVRVFVEKTAIGCQVSFLISSHLTHVAWQCNVPSGDILWLSLNEFGDMVLWAPGPHLWHKHDNKKCIGSIASKFYPCIIWPLMNRLNLGENRRSKNLFKCKNSISNGQFETPMKGKYTHLLDGASPDGWAVWGVVMFTRWWLLVDHCVLRNWDRILVRAVKGLISRVAWSRYVRYCDKETLNSNKPNLLDGESYVKGYCMSQKATKWVMEGGLL